jgi:hypothetical protein
MTNSNRCQLVMMYRNDSIKYQINNKLKIFIIFIYFNLIVTSYLFESGFVENVDINNRMLKKEDRKFLFIK